MDKCKLSNKDFHNRNKKSQMKKINPLFHKGTREVHRLQLVITHKINLKILIFFCFKEGLFFIIAKSFVNHIMIILM